MWCLSSSGVGWGSQVGWQKGKHAAKPWGHPRTRGKEPPHRPEREEEDGELFGTTETGSGEKGSKRTEGIKKYKNQLFAIFSGSKSFSSVWSLTNKTGPAPVSPSFLDSRVHHFPAAVYPLSTIFHHFP